MSTPFRPMLAADISDQLEKLRFPVYVTPKLDGVRAIIRADGVWSRSMKLLPHKGVQSLANDERLHGLDGELIVGSPTAPDVYRMTQSVTARADSEVMPKFWAFDCYDFNKDVRYRTRLQSALERIESVPDSRHAFVDLVPANRAEDMDELMNFEQMYLAEGYEGLILRNPEGLYKNGRSTVKEQGMLKLKRFVDGEAEIIGIEEEMHNGNTAGVNELGRTERSSHKAGLVGKGRMGALIVRDTVTKVEFKIGTGFTVKDREDFYVGCIGQVVRYKHFAIGAKDKPRFPTYTGLREGWDL